MSLLVWSFVVALSSYRLALPGYVFEFPRDHGSHPEYKLEWWYYTGHLRTSQGREFGYELTFFRTAVERQSENPSQWAVDDIYPAHFALSDLQDGTFHFFEKLNRRGPGLAGAASGRLHLWNENWSARMDSGIIHLRAAAGEVEIQLRLSPAKPPVIHGKDGISRKGEGQGRASHYYSLTRLVTEGTLELQGQRHQVSGQSWMDHEFGTNQLAPDQIGWDWFSIQLDQGEELMLYQIRRQDGSIDPYSSGTAVGTTGQGQHLGRDDFSIHSLRSWLSPESESRYPLDWIIRIPSLQAELHLSALLDSQELVTRRSTGIAYWEGAVSVKGQWKGQPVQGRGYVELTGYGKDSRPRI